MTALNQAFDYLRARRDVFLEEWKTWLRIPSISTLPEHRDDVRGMAECLADALRGVGIAHVELRPTPLHPIVFGQSDEAPGKPTVLVYGHYDVQPADPLNEWDSAPFEPEVRGDYMFARGASDMKGQFFALVKALEALRQQGPLPVNLKFLLEGEEEIGSPSLPDYIAQHREELACDVVLNCDAGIHAPNQPSITYALRGLAYFEVEFQGPGHDLHSGLFGGSLLNPIHALSAVLAGLHGAGGRVALPGFYDRVRPLSDQERALLQQAPHSDEAWLSMAGAVGLCGEAGYSTVERVGARPALDVNGIWGGFTGDGAKTVLPAKAHAKFSVRLVPDQRPEEVEAQVRAYFQENTPSDIQWKLHTHSWGPGAVMDTESVHMRAAVAALRDSFGAEPFFERHGGSVPVVGLLQQQLGADSIMLGFALPDDNIHGPNERQYLPNTFTGMEAYVRFLCALG